MKAGTTKVQTRRKKKRTRDTEGNVEERGGWRGVCVCVNRIEGKKKKISRLLVFTFLQN